MARNYISTILSCVLVAMHLNMSVSLLTIGHIFPILPFLHEQSHDQHPDRPVLLTSKAAPIIQPGLNLVKIVDTLLLGNVVQPLLGGLDTSDGQPSLPTSFVHVRQPETSVVTPAPGTGEDHSKDWSYDDSNDAIGPSNWHKLYPKCAGPLQSPVDIFGSTIKYRSIQPMTIRTLDRLGRMDVIIKNDGSSVSVKPTKPHIIIEGGRLPGSFVLTNIHFHWSPSDIKGSEHKLEGRDYPLEMHLVTFNSKYQTLKQASGADDGIHVVAVLYEMSKRRNMGLSFCTSKMDNITEPGSQVEGGTIKVSDLLPSPEVPFYRYRGSLTTPPCTENIIWTVFTTPQRISSQQLHKFRNLKLGSKTHPYLGANVRPVQAMGNRVVYTNNPSYRL